MKYECKDCGSKCELITENAPEVCIKQRSRVNWKKVEESAPKPLSEAILPKLTAAVFDREDCPDDAVCAVVGDADGNAYWLTTQPSLQDNHWVYTTTMLEKLLLVEKQHRIPGNFDSTDWQHSLIERPAKEKEVSKEDVEKFVKNNLNQGYLLVNGELKPMEPKLPDWVKVGAWVWCADCRAERKIEKINGNRITVRFPAPDATSYTGDISEFKPARVRPWTFEEAPYLFKTKDDVFVFVFLVREWGYFAKKEDREYTLAEVAELVQADGSPCGVAEVGK